MGDKLVILAGGISSRMKKSVASGNLDPWLQQEADQKPKAMIGVGAGKMPFLDYLLYNARSAGYTDIVIVIGEQDESIRSYYGNKNFGNEFHGLSISYAVQKIPEGRVKPLGTADALLQGLNAVPEWRGSCFTVTNSDNLYSVKALAALRQFTSSGGMIDYDRDAMGMEFDRVKQFAVIKKNAAGYLETIIEKPSAEEIALCCNEHGRVGVSMNLFRFYYDRILPTLQNVPLNAVRFEKELPDAVRLMVTSYPQEVMTLEFAEAVPDLTSKDDISWVRDVIKQSYPAALWK
ncbi:MAG: sugar phosphate nucleotidyltransferase [Bacteroidota bacterium]|nr:sugar phosphate nucleotidyltransferase [Bacteroidota bacterium]